MGSPVQCNTELTICHGATKELLSNDNIAYNNQFGKELEVSAKKQNVASRPQQLENESVGKKVVELSE